MELEHSFSVPVPVARAWDVLLDVERVAPCMPGASLDSVSGDDISGRIKVKVGPIQMTYAGTAKFTERDEASHVVVLEASGKETRGAGTASASVRSQLTPEGDQTRVDVHTTLNVTGKPAQFGRGVMTEVGGRLVGIFAGNLAAMLAADSVPANPAPADPVQANPEPANPDKRNADGNEAAAARAPDEALPIDVLNLTARAWSSLRQEGIQTVGDLTRRTQQQLLAIEGVGPASVADIRTKLADRGLALAEPSESAGPSESAESAAAADTEPGAGHADQGGAEAASLHDIGLNGGRPAGRHASVGDDGAAAGDDDLAEVKPLRPARHESPEPGVATPRVATPPVATPTPAPAPREPAASWQPPDNDAIDLLDVAGLPVLKRAVPAVAALIAVILVVVGVRRRRSGRR